MLRQPPTKLKNTNTHRDFLKEVKIKTLKDKHMKKEVQKNNVKVIELLNVGLRNIEV